MDFRLYISIKYIRREKKNRIRDKDLNNRSNTLKTLSTYNIIIKRIKNKKLKRLIYYLN
jgi:hypothetical protein